MVVFVAAALDVAVYADDTHRRTCSQLPILSFTPAQTQGHIDTQRYTYKHMGRQTDTPQIDRVPTITPPPPPQKKQKQKQKNKKKNPHTNKQTNKQTNEQKIKTKATTNKEYRQQQQTKQNN